MIADWELVTVQVLWDVLLAIAVLVVVPLVLYRANRLIWAARNIERHFRVTLAAAAGVIENTAPTKPALGQTISVATDILGVASDIDTHSAAIEGLLSQRALQGGAR